MKSLVAILLIIVIIVGGIALEEIFITNLFDDMNTMLNNIYIGIANDTPQTQELLSLIDWWANKKAILHMLIPHNEIREFDIYLAEATNFTTTNSKEMAMAKIAVLITLSKAVPNAFTLSLENVF